MKTKHTPGKIIVEGWFPPREPGLLPSVKATWDGRMIKMFSDDLEQAETDMRLLAAAPELLEALHEAMGCLSNFIPKQARGYQNGCFNFVAGGYDMWDCNCAICVCRRAIAKATGGSSC